MKKSSFNLVRPHFDLAYIHPLPLQVIHSVYPMPANLPAPWHEGQRWAGCATKTVPFPPQTVQADDKIRPVCPLPSQYPHFSGLGLIGEPQ